MTIPRISPKEASEKLADGWTYVDVRTAEEFDAGRPAGAVNVPISVMSGGGMQSNPEFAKVMQAAFAKDAKIVVGCKAGGRSMRAAQELVAKGFTNIVDQRAGWDGGRDSFGQFEPGWSRVGLPAETGPAPGRSWADMKAKAK
jgi:rhodanese-related sulfurtransferase